LDIGPTNASAFSLNPDGTFSYTPNADFFGDDTFTYKANDGTDDSNVATVTITVNAVNDAPSFTASNPPTVLEDAGTQTVPGFASFNPGPANESGQTVLSYTVSNVSNTALFSALPAVAQNGTLNLRPADLHHHRHTGQRRAGRDPEVASDPLRDPRDHRRGRRRQAQG